MRHSGIRHPACVICISTIFKRYKFWHKLTYQNVFTFMRSIMIMLFFRLNVSDHWNWAIIILLIILRSVNEEDSKHRKSIAFILNTIIFIRSNIPELTAPVNIRVLFHGSSIKFPVYKEQWKRFWVIHFDRFNCCDTNWRKNQEVQ